MRKWYKYFVTQSPEEEVLDHVNYAKKDYDRQPRFLIYDEYLRNTIRKDQHILSVGSGKCVNEKILSNDGYKVLCSDINTAMSGVVMYDVIQGPFSRKFDVIIALGVVFKFDEEKLKIAFNNMSLSLNDGGRLIIDVGGATDNLITRLIDGFCKYEMSLYYLYLKFLRRKNVFLIEKHVGFRISDGEMMKYSNGFKLKKILKYDTFTEIGKRSIILNRLNNKFPFFQRLTSFLGRGAPYIRIFDFEKRRGDN